MAYLSTTTFEIIPDDEKPTRFYFYVDDLLLVPIQILNNKGYTTNGCCEGHPYRASECVLFPNELYAESYGTENAVSIMNLPNGQIEVKYNLSPIKHTNLSIVFNGDIDLPDIPPGFIFHLCRLKYFYPFRDSIYDFYDDKLKITRLLLTWVKSLPNNPLK